MERPPTSDADRRREAEDALKRVARDSETLGGSAISRAGRRLGDHFAGRDAETGIEKADPVEIWGRRIGRALSVLVAVALVGWLLLQLGLR